MGTYAENVEAAGKRQWLVDSKRASQLGLNTYEFRTQRKAAVEKWTAVLRELMEQNGAYDPATVLPEICARIIEDTCEIARAEAEVAARSTVQKMLKRAMTPL
jgi:hypothetical protein